MHILQFPVLLCPEFFCGTLLQRYETPHQSEVLTGVGNAGKYWMEHA
jgi:hypothetical protein